MVAHALTIDLEDWHQLFYQRLTEELIQPTLNVVSDTHRLLDLLDETHIRTTFFVLGRIADIYPDLVREVARRGHEIGSHTYNHELVYRMEPDTFKANMERALKQLQDLTGQPILGFRAPEFSISNLKHWSFEILAELGFRYDSSVFPVPGVRYGIPEAPYSPFAIKTSSGTIYEFPLATWDVNRFRLPVAGGTYFRLLPGVLLRRALTEIDASGRTAVFYFHPYEFHHGWLYLTDLAWRHRLRRAHLIYSLLHNFCTNLIVLRLKPLLTQFEFTSLGEIYRNSYCTRQNHTG
jgi:polysaccharide deacetylase family protein (PEP-CTERM system associated)